LPQLAILVLDLHVLVKPNLALPYQMELVRVLTLTEHPLVLDPARVLEKQMHIRTDILESKELSQAGNRGVNELSSLFPAFLQFFFDEDVKGFHVDVQEDAIGLRHGRESPPRTVSVQQSNLSEETLGLVLINNVLNLHLLDVCSPSLLPSDKLGCVQLLLGSVVSLPLPIELLVG